MNHPSTILIVDDNTANRDTLTELLENPDYRLVEAANGPEALKLAAQLQPDLILLDVMMPAMDGFEVCRRLRADSRLGEVPVIMVTALDDRESRIMGIGCGADDFISKPFDRAELRTRVKTITRLNRYGRLLRERAKVDEANQKVREQAALIDLATDAIIVLDTDGRVRSWNPGAEKIFGTHAPEAHGRPLAALISTGESKRLESALCDTLLQGEWRGDLLAFRPNGDNVITHSHWTRLCHADGSARGILTVSTDQTEFKKLQAQFYRAQRMESLGALAGGIAHDLNNMLAPVLMAAEMLDGDIDAEERGEMVKTIKNCAQRGSGLVRQILSFARGQEGEERISIQLGHLITDIVRLARETFPKSITIKSQVDQNLLPLRADPTQLHQVLLNLLINARDAIAEGGSITISAETAQLDEAVVAPHPEAKPGPHVLLRVADTGSGMPPEVLAKICTPFFTTKPKGQGTGLGLSTVAGIIRSHGGFLEVTSAPGEGATFSVFLPAEPPADAATPVASTPAPPVELPLGHRERVLIVDDEVVLGQMVQALLSEHNYSPVAVDGASAALSAFSRGENFALALVDFSMPVMDGFRLARVLHNLKPGLKIILLTGSVEILQNQSHSDDFAAVVQKPFTAEALLTAVDRVLHG